MVTLFGVTLVLLCAVLAVLAGDPQTVFVGYKDGGFAGFQSQFHSVAYVSHTPRGTFVINNSPNSTAVELSVADATKSAAVSVTPEHGTAAKGVPTRPVYESTLKTLSLDASVGLNVHGSRVPGAPAAAQHAAPSGALSVGGVRQWALWALDDFNSPATSAGWFVVANGSLTATSVSEKRQGCNGSPDLHLGGYCAFASLEVGKRFSGLPQHSKLRVTARVHFLDSWRGEHAFARLDGAPTWAHSHNYCNKAFSSFCRGVDACGDNKFPDTLSHPVAFEVPHTADSALVTFGADLAGASACAASWALDDVAVYVI